LNRDNWLVETTSSGKLFHTLITRTAKKCFLQLTRASGTNKNKNKEVDMFLTLQHGN